MTALSMEFRLTLLNVGEYLTENDVQNLAFLCEGIKPAGRELLRNARELFVELQGRDLLNERNVSVLSGWLERLNLLDALRPLREYSEKFLKKNEIDKEAFHLLYYESLKEVVPAIEPLLNIFKELKLLKIEQDLKILFPDVYDNLYMK